MVSGVYAIQNALTGDRYVGSSKDVPARILGHFKSLVKGNHGNRHLQCAFNKYPDEVFFAYPLLWCDEANLLLFEQRCLDGLRPEYNLAVDAVAPMRGRKFSEESRWRCSIAAKGKPKSDEHRRNMSLAQMGNPGYMTGKRHSEESKQAIGQSNSKSHQGIPLGDAHKQAIADGLKRAWAEGRRGKRQ
jgi:group I intron endonuclease